MDFNAAALKLGYPLIFSAAPEDAAVNLLRLITNQDCGYDEGAHKWHEIVTDVLDGEYDLLKLNAYGAKLTED